MFTHQHGRARNMRSRNAAILVAVIIIGGTLMLGIMGVQLWNTIHQPTVVVTQGSQIVNSHRYTCTIGGTWHAHGKYYAVIAGHCGSKGEKLYTIASDGGWGPHVGTVVATGFTGDLNHQKINITPDAQDWSIVELGDKFAPKNGSGDATENPYGDVYHVLDRADAQHLESLCVYGARTGRKVCGSINQSASVGNFLTFMPVSGAVQKGDSGGPAFTKDGTLVGIISAKSDSAAYIYLVGGSLRSSGLL